MLVGTYGEESDVAECFEREVAAPETAHVLVVLSANLFEKLLIRLDNMWVIINSFVVLLFVVEPVPCDDTHLAQHTALASGSIADEVERAYGFRHVLF